MRYNSHKVVILQPNAVSFVRQALSACALTTPASSLLFQNAKLRISAPVKRHLAISSGSQVCLCVCMRLCVCVCVSLCVCVCVFSSEPFAHCFVNLVPIVQANFVLPCPMCLGLDQAENPCSRLLATSLALRLSATVLPPACIRFLLDCVLVFACLTRVVNRNRSRTIRHNCQRAESRYIVWFHS